MSEPARRRAARLGAARLRTRERLRDHRDVARAQRSPREADFAVAVERGRNQPSDALARRVLPAVLVVRRLPALRPTAEQRRATGEVSDLARLGHNDASKSRGDQVITIPKTSTGRSKALLVIEDFAWNCLVN